VGHVHVRAIDDGQAAGLEVVGHARLDRVTAASDGRPDPHRPHRADSGGRSLHDATQHAGPSGVHEDDPAPAGEHQRGAVRVEQPEDGTGAAGDQTVAGADDATLSAADLQQLRTEDGSRDAQRGQVEPGGSRHPSAVLEDGVGAVAALQGEVGGVIGSQADTAAAVAEGEEDPQRGGVLVDDQPEVPVPPLRQ